MAAITRSLIVEASKALTAEDKPLAESTDSEIRTWGKTMNKSGIKAFDAIEQWIANIETYAEVVGENDPKEEKNALAVAEKIQNLFNQMLALDNKLLGY